MGGNALPKAVTRRYAPDEYFKLSMRMIDALNHLFPYSRHERLAAYRTKESFGDMDIVLESDHLPSNWQEKIIEHFVLRPEEWVKNGNCLSFAYRQLQIDLITTPSSQYESSLSYYNWSDLGNLVGRIAHQLGLKLGHDGLSYNWRLDDTKHFRNVVLLTDWNDILPVLGLDPERYNQGFDTLEDIFKFVVWSPFFNKDIYLLHNRNNTSRTRDRKRKTYMSFLKWIETYEERDQQRYWAKWNEEHREVTGNKRHWLPYLFSKIEGFEAIYNEVQTEWDEAVKFKSRFNGDLVKEYIGLEGKELGEFMKWIRTTVNQDAFKRDVLALNVEVIPAYIKYWHDVYTGNLQVWDMDIREAPAVEDK